MRLAFHFFRTFRLRNLWVCCVLLSLLAGCSSSDPVKDRNRLATSEDELSACRLFTLQEGFETLLEQCHAFLAEDQRCANFPEQREGCIQFLRSSQYATQRVACKQVASQERDCEAMVSAKIPHWMYDAAEWLGIDWERQTWTEWLQAFEPKIHIAVVWSGSGGESFLNGLELGRDEINEQPNGVLGRQLQTHLYLTEGELHNSRVIAEDLRADKQIRAVIARQFSSNTIPVTYMYERSNIVYMAASATNSNVIRHGMRFIFRQLPTNDKFAKALVAFCEQSNLKRVAVLSTRDSYSEELSYAFLDYAIKAELDIVYEKSFFSRRESFIDIASDLKELGNDALDVIFLSSLSSTAVRVIEDLRTMGLDVPIIGSDSLDSDAFAQAVGSDGNGLIVPTIYNPFSKHPENAAFVKAYRKKYGFSPDTWAAQGYDAIKLLAYSIQHEAKSSLPANIATGLAYMPPQMGATGQYDYHKSGELEGKPIYFKELKHEEYILFKDTRQEEEQTQRLEIVDNRIIMRPEKPRESTEAMSAF